MYNGCMSRPLKKKTRPPRFDFDAEVARIRRDFPQETSQITFVDLMAADARQKIRDWVYRESGVSDEASAMPEDDLMIENIAAGNNRTTVSYASQSKLVTFRKDYTASLDIEADKIPYFGLYHELGHCLILQAIPDSEQAQDSPAESNKRECKADVFTLLYGIRNRVFDNRDARDIVKTRLWGAFAFDIGHFTSEAVENARQSVIRGGIDPKTETPRNIRALSHIFAEKSARRDADLKKLKTDLYEFGGQHRPEFVAILQDVSNNRTKHFAAFSKNPRLCRELKEYFQTLAAQQAPGSLDAFVASTAGAHLGALKRAA